MEGSFDPQRILPVIHASLHGFTHHLLITGYFCQPYGRVPTAFENQILQDGMAGHFSVYEPKIASRRGEALSVKDRLITDIIEVRVSCHCSRSYITSSGISPGFFGGEQLSPSRCNYYLSHF